MCLPWRPCRAIEQARAWQSTHAQYDGPVWGREAGYAAKVEQPSRVLAAVAAAQANVGSVAPDISGAYSLMELNAGADGRPAGGRGGSAALAADASTDFEAEVVLTAC